MSNERFTESVWKVVNHGEHHNNPMIDEISIEYGDDGENICETVYTESDAHLIASAPDMYRLLQHISASMECEHGVDCSEINELLAKARGESYFHQALKADSEGDTLKAQSIILDEVLRAKSEGES